MRVGDGSGSVSFASVRMVGLLAVVRLVSQDQLF